jgi:hypothetical protein
MIRKTCVLILLVCSLGASASTQEATQLRLNLDLGQKLTYSVTSTTDVDGPDPDVDPDVEIIRKMKITSLFDLVVKEKTSDQIKVSVTYRNMVTEMGDYKLQPTKNISYVQTQNYRGRVLKVDSKEFSAGQIAAMNMTSFEYPEKAVKLGDEWVVKTKADAAYGIPAMHIVYQIIERGDWNEHDSYTIKLFQDPSVKGDLKLTGTLIVDIKSGMTLQSDSVIVNKDAESTMTVETHLKLVE